MYSQREEWMSEAQWEICCWRAAGLTYRAIREECAMRGWPVPSDEGLTKCFMRTALGQYWVKGHQGGADYYLPEADELRVAAEVRRSAEELACCPTSYVLNLVYNAKLERLAFAVQFLNNLSCPDLALRVPLEAEEPSKDWLRGFCDRHDLQIRCARPLEEARRRWGNRTSVHNWFAQFGPVISQYHPSLVLNMDETGVASNGRFKVVTPRGCLPVCPMDRQGVHLTGVVTFSCTGKLFKTGIILPKLQNLPDELRPFTQDVNFYTSENGWMTRDVFLAWCTNLVHEISLWRPTLPPEIRGQRILLLLDGHPSRKNYAAIEYLRLNGIDVLTFPSHCTHLMQPFDVLIASALKSHLRSSIARWNHQLNNGWSPPAFSIVGAKRWVLVESFITALQQTLTTRICRESFIKSGLCPLNELVVTQNPLVSDEVVPESGRDWVSGRFFSAPLDHWRLAYEGGFVIPAFQTMCIRPLQAGDLVPRRRALLTPICPGLVSYQVMDFAGNFP